MRSLIIPDVIRAAIEGGALVVCNISGGKDSQAMAEALKSAFVANGWPLERLVCLHMHLGRMEWAETLAHCHTIAKRVENPLVVRQRRDGKDLLDGIEARMEKLRGTGKPFWPSAAQRYCTAGWKRATADNFYTGYQGVVISAEGLRAEESPARAKKPAVSVREQITATALQTLAPADALTALPTIPQIGRKLPRLALNWYPILDWQLEDVWEACGTSGADIERRRALYREGRHAEALDGLTVHPAYCYGNLRLSCQFCVLAGQGDLRNGAAHNPELWLKLRQMEIDGGATFKHKWSLAAVADAVPAEVRAQVVQPTPLPLAVANWPQSTDAQMELLPCEDW